MCATQIFNRENVENICKRILPTTTRNSYWNKLKPIPTRTNPKFYLSL